MTAAEYRISLERHLRHQRREMGAAVKSARDESTIRSLWRLYVACVHVIPAALRGELAPCAECGEWAPTHGECPNGHRADATKVPCPEGCENGEIRHAEVDASGCYESEPTTCETCGGRGAIPADETDEGWLRIYFLRALAHVRAHGFDLEVRL